MRNLALICLLLLSSLGIAQAQKVAWTFELSNVKQVRVLAADAKGGCVAVIINPDDTRRVLWLSSKGVKKAEFAVASDASGPSMVSPNRFYLDTGYPNTVLWCYTLNKKGEVKVTETPLNGGFTYAEQPTPADTKGFFVYSRELPQGTTTGYITRYIHESP